MPAVAIETVIIVIVVVSFAVLAAVVFALYWLWHLLLEDRRCSRLNSHSFHHEFYRQYSLGPLEDASNRTLLGSSRRLRNPRISRRRDVFVDERSRRLGKALRVESEATVVAVDSNTRSSGTSTNSSVTIVPRMVVPPALMEEVQPPDVVVLDGTEPPPPYEEIIR